jgi:hypothetical protein
MKFVSLFFAINHYLIFLILGNCPKKDRKVLCKLCGIYTVEISRHLQQKPHNVSSTIAKNWKIIFDSNTHAKLKICPTENFNQAVVRMDHHLRDKHADTLSFSQYQTFCKEYIKPKDWLRSIQLEIDKARTGQVMQNTDTTTSTSAKTSALQ